MGGKGDRLTIATPTVLRDAMIVPSARVPLPTSKQTFGLLEQNWIFSQQWKQADTAARMVVEAKVGGAEKDYPDHASFHELPQTARVVVRAPSTP